MGLNTGMDYSVFTERISFLQDFNQVVMMPLQHRNTINFLGMGQKQDYLIWREDAGFFVALSKQRKIHTWSVATGKHIDKVELDPAIKVEGYEIYRAGPEDKCFVSNFYNRKDYTI